MHRTEDNTAKDTASQAERTASVLSYLPWNLLSETFNSELLKIKNQ